MCILIITIAKIECFSLKFVVFLLKMAYFYIKIAVLFDYFEIKLQICAIIRLYRD